ncbi:MAG TPA: phage holin family protein, partial [Alphaproteobacteria bacterium]|nr:phage holin family protein [Alphaproteobacteria bacterium]
MIRWTRRVVTIWAIEFVALWLLGRWIPGLTLASWWTAILAVAVIALLNALLRPFLLVIMMPFTILTFGFAGILLNALMILLAARIVPGFSIDGWLTATWTTLGMAALGALLN